MKLVSFQVSTAIGPVVRIGAIGPGDGFVDLNAAYTHRLVASGSSPEAARRIAAAVLPGDMVEFIAGGPISLRAAHDALDHATAHDTVTESPHMVHEPGSVTLLPPVPHPPLLRDFMAFETHLKNIYPKLGREIPPEWYNLPVYYKGNPGSLGTHGQDVPIPSYADELDYEFELAMVIGTSGKDISREQAMDHVFGFMIYNDFSERAIQSREMSVGLGPAKGKDFHNAHVFGPYLVTKDEIANPYDLKMTSRVNGQVLCDDNSGTMHWKFDEMIAHASMSERIAVGEIFGSGTVGNGSGAERDQFLQRGDTIELEVEGLGVLRNQVT